MNDILCLKQQNFRLLRNLHWLETGFSPQSVTHTILQDFTSQRTFQIHSLLQVIFNLTGKVCLHVVSVTFCPLIVSFLEVLAPCWILHYLIIWGCVPVLWQFLAWKHWEWYPSLLEMFCECGHILLKILAILISRQTKIFSCFALKKLFGSLTHILGLGIKSFPIFWDWVFAEMLPAHTFVWQMVKCSLPKSRILWR